MKKKRRIYSQSLFVAVFYTEMLIALIFVCGCGRPHLGEGTITITEPPVVTAEPLGTPTSKPTEPRPSPTRQPEATDFPTVTLEPKPTAIVTPMPDATTVPMPTPEQAQKPQISTTPKPTWEPQSSATPEPTQKPQASATPELTQKPQASATPKPTKKPQASATPRPTQKPQASATPEPTKKPQASATPRPTQKPQASATPAPTQEAVPSPTKEPEETDIPMITPTINPLPLIYAGWQNTLDLTTHHYIVFPECFDRSVIEQDNLMISFLYTSSMDENIKFSIIYNIGQAYQDVIEELYMRGGVIEEHLPEEKSFSYVIEEGDAVFCGWIIEEYYDEELLGEKYQNEEISGIMRVEFSYPILFREQYETEEFRYYVVRID